MVSSLITTKIDNYQSYGFSHIAVRRGRGIQKNLIQNLK